MILLIDDDPTQRVVAKMELRRFARRLILPDSVDEVASVKTEYAGLVIIDRWLGDRWSTVVQSVVEKIPEPVPIWEWTCDEWNKPLYDRVQRTIFKRPGLLYEAVAEWMEARTRR